MDGTGAVVIHFDHGGDKNIYTLVMRGKYEEITYSRLVDRIGKKMNIDVAATKLHHSLWESYEIPDEILSQVVYPPHVERKKGRLQETRFPSAGEYRRKKKKKYPPLVCENDGIDSDESGSDGIDE